MFDKGQKQEAGDNALQVQGQNIIINNGITEERARAIYQEQNQIARKEYTEEAFRIADERVKKLEEEIIAKIKQNEKILPAFADPSFQILLRKAQLSAVETEREPDYKQLSEMLTYYIRKKEDRIKRTAIKKAIEIVGDVDNDALCALTLYYAVYNLIPLSGDIDEGLKILDTFFYDLIDTELPLGTEWIEHLEILNTIRISTDTINNRKIFQLYPKILDGYTCVGIPKDTTIYINALQLLDSVNINHNIMMPNVLLNGYFRLPFIQKDKYDDFLCYQLGRINKELTKEHINVLNEVRKLYVDDHELKKQVEYEFIRKWDSFPTLKKLHKWWDSIPLKFTINLIGEIIAVTNGYRCRPDFPNKFLYNNNIK